MSSLKFFCVFHQGDLQSQTKSTAFGSASYEFTFGAGSYGLKTTVFTYAGKNGQPSPAWKGSAEVPFQRPKLAL